MRFAARIALALMILALDRASAGEDEAPVRLDLRVGSTGPGTSVVIDRGARDGVAVGDRVLFFPRGGTVREGTVVKVDERSAVVEPHDKRFLPPAGTRGEVLVRPEGRAEPKEPAPPPPGPLPDHPPWENGDEGFSPDQPLLAGMRPVRPAERAPRLSGYAYTVAQLTADLEGAMDNSYVRTGVDVLYENLLGRGGGLRANVELDYLTEEENLEGLDLLVHWLSYAEGGTRFAPMRWEAGRFLQDGMPEFGTLDGVEWGMRRANGHRYGASVGFLPEPDDDFESFSDLQVGAYYEWVSGPREKVSLRAGYQKTWHHGKADRDLLVADFRVLPIRGWDFHGSIWIDLYTGSDDLKGSGAEVTQAVASLGRRWGSSGLNVDYQHWSYPELLRQGEFPPPLATEIATNRYDRLALDAWWLAWGHVRFHGNAAGWIDEDGDGAAGDLGFELRDLVFEGSRADVTVFATLGQFEEVYGARATFGRSLPRGSWDLLYEIAAHHELDFADDRDDIIQHRVRGSASLFFASGWSVSTYAEAVFWDTDLTWSLGFTLQKDF